jgi:hypothetical protein
MSGQGGYDASFCQRSRPIPTASQAILAGPPRSGRPGPGSENAGAQGAPFETTYQGSYCRQYEQPLVPLLSRQTSTVPGSPPQYRYRDSADAGPGEGGKGFETTYQGAFCTPFPQVVLSSSEVARDRPRYRAISGTTTHNAPKLRDEDRMSRYMTGPRGSWSLPQGVRYSEHVA